MKIRSLLLGSIAAAGLATGAHAADLGVLTSLDVCDALGLSGLTISSDTNCLQISGGVSYEFQVGNFKVAQPIANTPDDTYTIPGTIGVGGAGVGGAVGNVLGNGTPGGTTDWTSKMIAWLKFVGTADSDFGPAKAVIRFKNEQFRNYVNTDGFLADGTPTGLSSYDGDDTTNGGKNGGWIADEAYVAIGDSTVIMAGKKGSIINYGDDEPYNWLGLFNSDNVDKGVLWNPTSIGLLNDGGTVLQVVSDLGNGVSVGAGLEDIVDNNSSLIVPGQAGNLVGVISYAGDSISAHLSAAAVGVLDGVVNGYVYHTGFTGTFDNFKIRGALAGSNGFAISAANPVSNYWNGLLSGQATFDMFTLALSGEAANSVDGTDYGIGASATAAISEGVSLNIGGRWYHDATGSGLGGTGDAYQVAASVSAAVTETITLTGEVGAFGNNSTAALSGLNGTAIYYGAAQAAWAPGGGFTGSVKGEAYSNGAYKATFKAAKDFQ
jgi:hypothetical protein